MRYLKKSLAMVGLTAAIWGAAATSAHATLIGDEVTAGVSGGNVSLNGSQTAIVQDSGMDFEFNIGSACCGNDNVVGFDVDGSSITMTNLFSQDLLIGHTPGVNSGPTFTFTDLDWTNGPGAIIGAVTSSTQGVSLGNNFTLSTTSDSVTFDFAGSTGVTTRINRGESITANLEVAHDVPTPASLSLLGMGLIGLGFAGARRNRDS